MLLAQISYYYAVAIHYHSMVSLFFISVIKELEHLNEIEAKSIIYNNEGLIILIMLTKIRRFI